MIEIRNGIPFVAFSLFRRAGGVTAAVASRRGGVSKAPFDTLNMSFSTGDDPAAVRENRKRFLSLLHIPAESIISCHQVHGTHIEIVGRADCGRGAKEADTAIPACDGLMTQEKNVPLTMNFADCTPLLFYDPVHHAAGVAHGGWRGTAGDIGGKMVQLFHETYGTRPEDLLAGVGPAIGGCCFEVGQDVIDAFSALFGLEEMGRLAREKGGGKYLFDLPEANRLLLLRAGMTSHHIEMSGLCTYCRDDLFFSYRKSGGRTGRHMAAVMLL